jgi:hypothetical protein
VTELSAELARAIHSLREAERQQPRPAVEPHPRYRLEYTRTLKALEQSSQQLNHRLRAGVGRAETLAIARKLRVLVHDAQLYGAKIMQTEQVSARIAPARAALEALAPYYFDEPSSPDPLPQPPPEPAREKPAQAPP